MLKSIRFARIYYIAIPILTIIGATLRTLALLLPDGTPDVYFSSALPLAKIFTLLFADAILSLVIFPFLLNKDLLDKKPAPLSVAGKATSVTMAALLLLNFVASLLLPKSFGVPGFLLFVGVLASLVGLVYFLLPVLNRVSSTTVAALGTAVILALASYICLTYFDRLVPMNAPQKTHLHLALLSLMFYMLYELRAAAGAAMPRAQLAATGVAFYLSATVGFSNLFAFAAGTTLDKVYLAHTLLLVGFTAYIGTRGVAQCLALSESKKKKAGGKK